MRSWRILILLIAVLAMSWGCVEELEPETNVAPRVWFIRGPEDADTVRSNAAEFEWVATDVDDDLGMGAAYVSLEPNTVPGLNTEEQETIYFDHAEGWVRVYEGIYQILDLPDSEFVFSVRIADGRGGETVVNRFFVVRFDDRFPVVDSVTCPPGKPRNPTFCPTYEIFAHDVARSARAATPTVELEYSYRFIGPPGFDTV